VGERRTFKVTSPAKLNLTFSIVGTLPDGYHEVETLMQAIDLEDEIKFSIEESSQYNFSISTVQKNAVLDFPLDSSNLVGKAADLFLKELGGKTISLQAEVKKLIPIEAGMGGGSSNAAATLLTLNRYFNFPFQKSNLEEMAAKLGADVPFFIHGGTQIGRHRGDKLSIIPTAEKMFFTIVNPRELSIATPWIYEQYDKFISVNDRSLEISLKNACGARVDGSVFMAAQSFGNVFEEIVYDTHPELKAVRERIMEAGAMGCFMTGSGPTLFALCDSEKTSTALAKHFRQMTIPIQNAVKGGVESLTLDAWSAITINRGPTVVEISPQAVRQRR
jgi:4-diphosphocytidyl-2-C-methyl-D-erythritol kinase